MINAIRNVMWQVFPLLHRHVGVMKYAPFSLGYNTGGARSVPSIDSIGRAELDPGRAEHR